MRTVFIYNPHHSTAGAFFTMYVCVCYAVTDTQIQEAVHQGDITLAAVKKRLGVGSQCGKCIQTTLEVIQRQLDVEPNYYEVA